MFFQAEDGIRDYDVTGVQTCALPISVLQLSEEAKRIWTAYFNKVEESLKQGGEFAEVKDFASKTAEQAARISGVLHVFEFGPEGEIQPDTKIGRASCRERV